MESARATARLEDLPGRPARQFTRRDVFLIVGAGVFTYFGGVFAALGSIAGPVLAGAAGLMAVTVCATRYGRTNEPRVGPARNFVAIFVSTVIFLNAVNLWKGATYSNVWVVTLAPLVSVGIYLIFLVILFGKRRR